MNLGTVGGLAILGTIAAAWDRIKGFFNSVRSLVLVTHTLETYSKDCCLSWCSQLVKNCRVPRLSKQYQLTYMTCKDGTTEMVLAELVLDGTFVAFYKGVIPVIFEISNNDHYKLSATFLRGTYPVNKHLVDAAKIADRFDNNVYYPRWDICHVWGTLGEKPKLSSGGNEQVEDAKSPSLKINEYNDIMHGVAKMVYTRNPDNLGYMQRDDIIAHRKKKAQRFQTESEKRMRHNIEFWLKNREWYVQRGIPWKRGALLYGPPGTGKSSMIWDISRELDLPVFIMHIESFRNQDIYSRWESSSRGCIVLIEDIDSVFQGRKNVVQTQMDATPLSFDALLNVIDGVDHNEGTFLIITSNHPEHLDTALIGLDENGVPTATRPGRVDFAIECGPLEYEGAQHIAQNILSDWDDAEREKFVAEFDFPLPAAVIQEKCVEAALNKKWKSPHLEAVHPYNSTTEKIA